MVSKEEVGTLQRSFRAKAILRRENAVKPLGNGLWLVESQYRPGDFYKVNLVAKSCHCQDFIRRGPAPCKHILAAQEADKASRRRRVKIDDITPDGKVLAWHYTDEPATEQQPASATDDERQRRIAAEGAVRRQRQTENEACLARLAESDRAGSGVLQLRSPWTGERLFGESRTPGGLRLSWTVSRGRGEVQWRLR